MEPTPGGTAVNLQETGLTTKCTAKDCSLGMMDENTKANILTTKRKAMESFRGLMDENMMEAG